ncbi:MAG: hypothetical protein ACYDH9_22425 [Limisphaerales bacterium]
MNHDICPTTSPFLSLAFAAILVGCDTLQPTTPRPPAAQPPAAYLDVPYAKFVSGVYVDELKDKYVSITCTFYSVMAGVVPGGFSPDRYLAFKVVAPSAMTPGGLTVVAPKEMADAVFALKYGEAIVAHGRAFEVIVTEDSGKVFRSLALEAQKVERAQ